MAKKTIITIATTGAWPTKANNPNVPMTPAEIAEDVYDCWKAGAAIAHLHMRDDNGKGMVAHVVSYRNIKIHVTTFMFFHELGQFCFFLSIEIWCLF